MIRPISLNQNPVSHAELQRTPSLIPPGIIMNQVSVIFVHRTAVSFGKNILTQIPVGEKCKVLIRSQV